MPESYYNAIIDTPEKAAYLYHRLIPGMVFMLLLTISIIVLVVFVWKRCGRNTATLGTVMSSILVVFDLALICADFVMVHYCLTGVNIVNKYGTVLSRSLGGEFHCYCLSWKPVLLNLLAIIILAIVLRKQMSPKNHLH